MKWKVVSASENDGRGWHPPDPGLLRRQPDGRQDDARRLRDRGLQFTALNGGPQFTPDEAVSFQILCKDQAEIDRYWEALVDGGGEQPCGWLRDRFDVSWQIFPTSLYDLLAEGDSARLERATAAVSTFGKLDMAAIEAAANG